MTYQEFLKTKELKAESCGFDIDRDSINPYAFDYQKDIIAWACKKGKCAVLIGCGCGKTLIQLEWAKAVNTHTHTPVLIIAPLSVVEQTRREAAKFGICEVNVCRKQADVVDSVNITNYEMVEHFNGSAFSGVVLDECFAPDTLIKAVEDDDTIIEKKICDIKPGDRVINCIGLDKVIATRRKKVPYAIKIGFNGKTIICSPRHPFFTQRGWVCAKELQREDVLISNNEAMRILRGDVSDSILSREIETLLQSLLFCEMEDVSTGNQSEGTHRGNTRENWKESLGLAKHNEKGAREYRENTESKSDEQSRIKEEGICHIAGDAPRTFKAWGKWSRPDIAAAVNDGCIARDMGNGITYISGEETARIPDELQSRLRELRDENCNRDRWELTSFEKRTRQEEGRKTGFFGLESFEVLESGCPELDKYRDADGALYFYDIEVERHPSFTVNGCLVHNSSILKSFTGKYKTVLTEMFHDTPYRMLCTATIAPNDYTEIGTSCEFLGIMSRSEMLATYFIHDGGDTSKWRLKKAGVSKFWEWFATWAIYFNSPKDLGYSGEGYDLPPLNINRVITESETRDGELVVMLANTLEERRQARKESIEIRTDKAADLANNDDSQWLLWVDYNDESTMLKRKTNNSVEVKGSDSPEFKAQSSLDFADGKIHALVSKSSIFGFGSNFQSCHNMVFCGLSDSYERLYQAIRRCWRFGQKYPVNVYIILSEREMNVLDNITRKQGQMDEMQKQMTALMKEVTLAEIRHTTRITTEYKPEMKMEVPQWAI